MSAATGITGFLEEAPGVRSIVRLTAAEMVGCIIALVIAAIVVAIKGGADAAGIIAALSSMVAGLSAGVWAALKVRNAPEATS